MRVKLKSAVILPSCEIAPAGVTLEVSEEVAKDWCARGIAEEAPAPMPDPVAKPVSQQQTKGKR